VTPAAAQSRAPLALAGPARRPAVLAGYRDSPACHVSADFAPEPAAARRARRLTRDTLERWDLAHLADDAETIASELTSNALAAATGPRGTLPAILFAIHRRPGEVRIIVWDNGPGRPRPAAPGPDAESGRGLAIVATLSRHWGWWPTPVSGGKVVWSALHAPGGPGGRGQDAPGKTQAQPSGGKAVHAALPHRAPGDGPQDSPC
jgi:anti-sigma regulatory factor (Ser/Thr protein kinase)